MLRVKNKPVHWIIVPNILDGNICGNCDGEGFGLRKVRGIHYVWKVSTKL